MHDLGKAEKGGGDVTYLPTQPKVTQCAVCWIHHCLLMCTVTHWCLFLVIPLKKVFFPLFILLRCSFRLQDINLINHMWLLVTEQLLCTSLPDSSMTTVTGRSFYRGLLLIKHMQQRRSGQGRTAGLWIKSNNALLREYMLSFTALNLNKR